MFLSITSSGDFSNKKVWHDALSLKVFLARYIRYILIFLFSDILPTQSRFIKYVHSFYIQSISTAITYSPWPFMWQSLRWKWICNMFLVFENPCRSGTCLKYEKRLLLRCIHHFESEVIQKVVKWCPKSVNSILSQMELCHKPTKLQFQSILTRKMLMLSNATNQPKSTVELGYMCPRVLLGPPAVTLTKWLKYEKRLPLR